MFLYFKIPRYLVVVVFLLSACGISPQPSDKDKMLAKDPTDSLEPTESFDMQLASCPSSVLSDYQTDDLVYAVEESIKYYKRKAKSNFTFDQEVYTGVEMIKSLKLFLDLLQTSEWYTDKRLELLNASFDCYIMGGLANKGNVLFTGYFTPIIEGSIAKRKNYNVPVYGVPKDLKVLDLGRFRSSLNRRTIVYRLQQNKLLPYYERSEIVGGALKNKAKIVAWVKDKIDLFFLEIQGSGVLIDHEKNKYQLFYAGSNGRDYSSIGRLLVQEGAMSLEETSLNSIDRYLRNNPEQQDRVLNSNKNYVFFKSQGFSGKIVGSIGQKLTYKRSAALDALMYPRGSLLFVDTLIQNCGLDGVCTESEQPFKRFMLNQDTGGAIKGSTRIDLYMGAGLWSKNVASSLRTRGNVYFIVAKKSVLAGNP